MRFKKVMMDRGLNNLPDYGEIVRRCFPAGVASRRASGAVSASICRRRLAKKKTMSEQLGTGMLATSFSWW